MAELYYKATLDDKQFQERMKAVNASIRDSGETAKSESRAIDTQMRSLSGAAAAAFGGAALAKFAQQVATVRGQFQQLEVSFSTMLQSKQKADELMAQVVELAAKTPFDLQGVAAGAKSLLAYGSAANEVTGELTMLGNIASGLSIPLSDIVYLYGTTRTQGRMYTQDLRQFMGRGIPLAEELAKQFGVAKDEVGGLVTAGKVGFEDMRKALVSMTSEGGKFYNLMEAQSKTISGQISNLGDAFQQMLNDIGKSTEGVIGGTLSAAQWAVEHWRELGKVMLTVIATYGTYRAALIAVAAAQKVALLAEQTTQWFRMAQALGVATANQIAFNGAVKANVYVALASILVGIVTALVQFSKKTSDAAKSIAQLQAGVNGELGTLDDLKTKLDSAATSQQGRTAAIGEFNAQFGDYVGNLLTEKSTAEEIAAAYDKAKNAIIDKNLASAKETYTAGSKKAYDKAQDKFSNTLSKTFDDKLSDKQMGRFTAQVQEWLTKSKAWATRDDLYEAVNRMYAEYGKGELTQREKGNLFGASESLIDTRREYENGQAAYEAYASGYESMRKKTVTKTDGPKKKDAATKATKAAAEDYSEEEAAQKAYLQAVVDAKTKMEETLYDEAKAGTTDRIALIDLERDRTLAAIEAERAQYVALALAAGDYSPDTSSFDVREIKAVNGAETSKAAIVKDEVAQYQTVEQQKQAIAEKYTTIINDFIRAGYRENAEVARREMNAQLDALAVKSEGVWREIFRDVGSMTKSELTRNIATAESKIGTLSGDPEQTKAVQEQIHAMREELQGIDDIDLSATMDGLLADWKKLNILQREYDGTQDKTTDGAKDLASQIARLKENMKSGLAGVGINAFNSGLKKAADTMAELAEISGSDSLKNASELLSGISTTLSATLSGAATGGAVGAAVGAGVSMIGQLIDGFIATAKAEEEAKAAAADYQMQLDVLSVTFDSSKYDTLFGTNSLAKAKGAYAAAQDALAKYTAAYEQSITEQSAVEQTSSLGGATRDWNKYQQLVDASKAGYNNLQGMSVKTKDYGGFVTWMTGLQDQYKSLYDLAPQMWGNDVNGEFDIDAAEKFLATNKQITQTQRDQIQNAIDLQKEYEKSMEELSAVVEEYTSEMASDLASSMWDAVAGGTSAWDDWQQTGSAAIAKIGKQMIAEMISSAWMEQYGQRLTDAFGGKSNEKPEDVLNDMYANMGDLYKLSQKATEDYQAWMKEQGLDPNAGGEASTSSTSSGGFTTMSQETGSELSGRFGDLQIKAASILGACNTMAGSVTDLRGYAALNNEYLYSIKMFTSNLPAMLNRLNKIATNTDSL